MNPIEVFTSKKSSKAELRAALGEVLGLAVEPPTERPKSLFKECQEIFEKAYKEYTGLTYSFGAKDRLALKQLLDKITELKPGMSTENIKLTFEALLNKLPDWYRQNQFSLPGINSGFNNIVLQIKNKQNGSKTISADYKQRIFNDLLS
ncbi:MAG: hypothetical protein RR328_04540 [Bacteroidales bacterium]